MTPGNYFSIPTLWRVIGNSEGVGERFKRETLLKESMKLKWNFQRDGERRGLKPKNLHVRGTVWIFPGNEFYVHQFKTSIFELFF